jgi:FkbM family methyltransferase
MVTSRLHPNSLLSRLMISAYGRAHGVGVSFHDDYISFRRSSGREIRIGRREFPYSRDMIVAFDSYYGAVVPDARGVVDFSRPGKHRYAKSGLEFSLPSVAEEDGTLEGCYYWHTPKAGDLVFDIGAHAGVSTHMLAKTVGPHGKVYAFEPDPTAFPHLQRNIEAHGLQNVTAVPKAIAARRGRLAFHSEGSLGSALVDVASREGTGDTIEVGAITFADACAMAGAAPTYVKMDIEGAELAVIAASRELLRKFKIHFFVDTNHMVDGGLTHRPLERLFTDAGYEATSSARYGFMTTWARPRGGN